MAPRKRSANDNIPVDAYSVTVEPLSLADGGGFLARVPELPGCVASGDTAEAALLDARDAIRAWILTAREFGDPVPPPSSALSYSGKWLQRVPKTLHRRLADQARREGVSLNQLATALLAQGLSAPAARSRRRRAGAGGRRGDN